MPISASTGAINVLAQRLEDAEGIGQFDMICAFHVLEHSPDPLGFLECCRELLAEGGRIYLEVPNINEALMTIYDIPSFRNLFYRKAHCYYYSAETLAMLMSKAGHKGEITFAQDYSIFNHLHWLARGCGQSNRAAGEAVPEAMEPVGGFLKEINTKYQKLLESTGRAENLCYLGVINDSR